MALLRLAAGNVHGDTGGGSHLAHLVDFCTPTPLSAGVMALHTVATADAALASSVEERA